MKIFLVSIFTLTILAIAFVYFSLNKKLPEGKTGPEADSFALRIQEAVKHDLYLDTDYIQWSFRNKHHYLWDRRQNTVKVQWEKHTAHLDLNAPHHSFLANKDHTQKEVKELINTAQGYFNNDSFWIVAPHKLFDKGVTRSLITLDDDSKSLLVTYRSGGTTPGDSYLWKVDKNYLPTSFQMWVSIIPIGGIEATWEGWTITQSGAYLSQKHKLLGFNIPISNLKAWNE